MTSDDETRSPRRRQPRRSEPEGPDTPASGNQGVDQGDLWADSQAATGAESDEPPSGDQPDRESGDEPVDEVDSPASSSEFAGLDQAPQPPWAASARPIDDGDDVDYYAAEPDNTMLRSPYLLAGLAVAAAIVLAVLAVVLFAGGGDGGDGPGGVVARPLTPQPGDLPGVAAEAIAVAAIREGPGREYLEVGQLRNGQDVNVVGRDEDANWFQIIFADSDIEGWVPDSALRLPDDTESLIEVVGSTPGPEPTVTPVTATIEPTPTEEALGAPDIAVEVVGNNCSLGQPLVVIVTNVGDVPLNGRQILVTVSTPDAVLSEESFSLNLAPGGAVPIATGQLVQPPRTIVSITFVNQPQDTDPSNNFVTCVLSSGGAGSTVPDPTSTPMP